MSRGPYCDDQCSSPHFCAEASCERERAAARRGQEAIITEASYVLGDLPADPRDMILGDIP